MPRQPDRRSCHVVPSDQPQLLRADARPPVGSGQRQSSGQACCRGFGNWLPQFRVLSCDKCWSRTLTGPRRASGSGTSSWAHMFGPTRHMPWGRLNWEAHRHLKLKDDPCCFAGSGTGAHALFESDTGLSLVPLAGGRGPAAHWGQEPAPTSPRGPAPRSQEQLGTCRDERAHHRSQHTPHIGLLPITQGAVLTPLPAQHPADYSS